jgi:hypothetical protein
VHGDQVGRVPGGHLRRQLRIARPGDDVAADVNVGVFRVELVDHRGDDPAFALDLRHIRRAAELGAAFAEKALQIDLRPIAARVTVAAREEQRRNRQQVSQRTAVPAIARTICFWKST